ncbi:MAG TPA: delta-aminolevulinic acid dehydratase, partial [Bacteroidia bacterium]|nr:delta-aminolevulinic acid dehydratase [Bacteroidia bacterium]
DPYDALTSSVFTLPLFKNNKFIRFGIQQLVKRSPLDLRPLLFIKKGYNPVTLGLCIQGYTNLGESGIISKEQVIQKCNFLIDELQKMKSNGYQGACWGYDFPWESRHAKIPAFEPTIVATGFITNALFLYYQYSKNQTAIDLCRSACDFILKDIKKTTNEDGSFCFSYSPFDDYQVFNASMKGVRTLSQV